MSNDELPSALPPPLPPGRRPSPLTVQAPVTSNLQSKPVAVPVTVPSPAPSTVVIPAPHPVPLATTPGGRLWWVWCLAGVLACLALFVVCLSCNPATTATERALGKLQGAITQQMGPDMHPLISWGVSLLFNKYIALPYAQMQFVGLMFAFIACLLLPAGCSLLSAAIGHPIYMIGGAPGGWRSTWQNHGLHRLTCDAASLLVIALALIAPMEPTTAAAVLIFFLPAIRVGSMITLWVLLARSHGFGPVRIIFLGLPSIFFTSIFSGIVAFILALYFYAYLVARSF